MVNTDTEEKAIKPRFLRLQGSHGRFLAGKAAIVVATSPPPLSNSQNLGKDQALPSLPPVAALKGCHGEPRNPVPRGFYTPIMG